MKGSFLVLIISAVISISAVSGNQFVDLVTETYRGGEDINNQSKFTGKNKIDVKCEFKPPHLEFQYQKYLVVIRLK